MIIEHKMINAQLARLLYSVIAAMVLLGFALPLRAAEVTQQLHVGR
jgi:hypothetical protein